MSATTRPLRSTTQALTGLYQHDPNLMLGLAQAQFGKGDASAARATLDELIASNPDFRSPAGHLLYARALEAEGNTAKALEEYSVVAPAYPGAEAAVRYAQLLQAQGRTAEAQKVARELLEQARIAPAHYRARAAGVAGRRAAPVIARAPRAGAAPPESAG